jgi:hypothetical protein
VKTDAREAMSVRNVKVAGRMKTARLDVRSVKNVRNAKSVMTLEVHGPMINVVAAEQRLTAGRREVPKRKAVNQRTFAWTVQESKR